MLIRGVANCQPN